MKRQKKFFSRPFTFVHFPFIPFLALILLFFMCATVVYSAQVTLIWDPNSEPDLFGYKLYYKILSSGGPYNGTGAGEGPSPITLRVESLPDPDNPECTLSGLKNNEIYFFVVTAYNENGESLYSKEFVYNTGNAFVTDFGSGYGLWYYNGKDWVELDSSDPEYLGSYDKNIVIDFGTRGLWQYSNSFWIDLSTSNLDNSGNTMVVFNDEPVFDFGEQGVWSFDGEALVELTDMNAEWLGVYNNKLICDFGTSGLWEYDGVSWSQIDSSDADNSGETMVRYGDRAAFDFGSVGVWSYNGSELTKINDGDAEWLGVHNGNLICDFGSSGLWEHNGSSWVDISTSNPDNLGNSMVAWGRQLVLDFGSSGIWSYDGDEFTEMTDLDSEWLAVYGNKLVCDFGSSGLWEYDGSEWTDINTTNADNSGNTLVACMKQAIGGILGLPGILLLLLGQ